VPVYKKVNKDFFKKWTPEMAYVLGFFAADGYITVNKRGGQFWCIQITDRKILFSIRKAIASEHTISMRKASSSTSSVYRLQIGSIEMCNDLRKLGYTERKTKSLAIPHIPKKYFPDFVRGYFDGDGNVWLGLIHKERKKSTFTIMMMFTSCSHIFLQQLHEVLTYLGIQGGSIHRSKDNYSRLKLSSNDSLKLYEIMYNTGAVNNLYLQRKKRIFENYLKMRT
jgi:intein-encoded DNA endonuclease-like protein